MKVHVHGEGHLAEITREFLGVQYSPQEASIIWACEDTPLVDGLADTNSVMDGIVNVCRVNRNAMCIVSSQLPVGSIKQLEARLPEVRFACCPENFKKTDRGNDYLNQSRFVIGTRRLEDKEFLIDGGFFRFAHHLEWMTIESAEMTKHALNAYLGMCITFINEIKAICDMVGADIHEVERGLLTEARVSMKAPLRAGEPFGGGHIDRDLSYLKAILPRPLLKAIQVSNDARKYR